MTARPKIYFAGSIRGGRDDIPVYRGIVDHLRERGDVFTEHVADDALTESGEAGMTDRQICERDLEWIGKADVVVAEVTTPSLGVGYEIAKAEVLGKPVLCLFRENTGRLLSAMIAGSERCVVRRYGTLEEAATAVDEFLTGAIPR